jgi:outer membrane protein TolC
MNTSRFSHWALCVLAGLPLVMSGCQRSFYRTQADDEVACIVDERSHDPRWALEDFTIAADPRSRFYDGTDPDYTPMPPDDPESHAYMHRVDGKNGYPYWHANGETQFVENPSWMQFLSLDQDSVLVLDSTAAVDLARLHSRDYQLNLEELYLSALDVTFERFRFDAQFFAGYQAFYDVAGPLAPGRGGQSSSRITTGTFPGQRGIRMNRLTSSGGEFVVGLANSMVWEFSGPDTQSATTLIDFALVQPLLRGGGRDRVLERLTLAERTLLSNVRAMQRYRQEFYVDIITGRNPGAGPQRRGGVLGSGLEGFSGVGGSGFGNVATGAQVAAGAAGVAGGAGAAQAGGFIGLLQQQQTIRNQEANIASLRTSLAQLEAFYDAGRIDYFQVELARQALYNAQSVLLNARTNYQNQLDVYKGDLGIPPTLEIRITDPLLEPFNLIDNAAVPLQNEVADLQTAVGKSLTVLEGQLAGEDDMTGIPFNSEVVRQLKLLRTYVQRAEKVRLRLLAENLQRAYQDVDKLIEVTPERTADMRRLQARVREAEARLQSSEARGDYQRATLDADIFNVDRLEKMPAQIRQSLAELKIRWQSYAATHERMLNNVNGLLERGPDLAPPAVLTELNEKVLTDIPNHLNELSASILELTLGQARARVETVALHPIDLTSGRAIEIARENRLDWMNARASLVDSWRLIEFNADNLESQLDLLVSGDVSNTNSNPLSLDDQTGRLRVGLQFDSPLTRLQERNTYRQSLIEYQQARRNYYNFEDTIKRALRTELRSVELSQLNFELRRAAVHVAVAQVELTRLRLQEPPKPGVEQAFSNTTARDLVSALSDLLNVQNDFLSVWVNYEVQRRFLDLDLGTMQLDARGLWVDPGTIGPDYFAGEPDYCHDPTPPCLEAADPPGPVLPEVTPTAPAEELPPPEPSNDGPEL